MRDVYVVSFMGGTAGAFIAGLIYAWLSKNKLPLIYSQFGDSHETEIYRENWNRFDSVVYDTDQILKVLRPKIQHQPFVVRQHFILDEDVVRQNFNTYLHAKVTIHPKDSELIGAFRFFKWVIRQYNLLNYSVWDSIKEEDINPNLLEGDRLQYYIRKMGLHCANKNSEWCSEINDNNNFSIAFHDIMFNKEKTLQLISERIELPITNVISASYDNYLYANKNLLRYKCPWVLF